MAIACVLMVGVVISSVVLSVWLLRAVVREVIRLRMW